jgi:CHRD domain-containing protein
MLKTICAALLVALSLAAAAGGSGQEKPIKLVANLKAQSEVPAPHGVPADAVGFFSGMARERPDGGATLTWSLTFSHLSGPASGGSHIHLAKPGKAGPVVAALCGPCKSGQRGTVVLKEATFTALLAGGTYVNVHTVKNPAGEIRGQVKLTKTQPAAKG